MTGKALVPDEVFPLTEISIDPQFALTTQFMAEMADAERKSGVKRNYAVLITRKMDNLIDKIVQDSRCGYYHSIPLFVQHALYLLVDAYESMGYPDIELGAELLHERKVRNDAEAARKRTTYIDAIHDLEDELNYARLHGDWESLAMHLAVVESYLLTAPTPAARQRVLQASAGSFAFRQTVLFLDELDNLPDEIRHRIDRWRSYLEDVN